MYAMSISHEQIAADLNALARYLALDDFGAEPPGQQDLRSVDVIALVGNQVLATFNHACSLAQLAPHAALVFSGGVGHATRPLFENFLADANIGARCAISPGMAEAQMYLVAAEHAFGIPASRILVEDRSTNGGENARFSIRALRDAGLKQRTVLLLQDPTMQRRSVLTWQREAELAGIGARVLSHAVFVPCVEAAADGALRICADQAVGSWSFDRLAGLLLGEIRRLRDDENGYGPRGQNFIPHVDIPETVLESYARLAASNMILNLEGSAGFQR